MPKEVGAATVCPQRASLTSPCRALHRADKGGAIAVWHRWDVSVQHFGLSGVTVQRSARLFLCARCRAQVVLCSQCDRGNSYCGGMCWRLSRQEAQRAAGRRYQASRRGRHAHAERSRRWRQRRAASARADAHDEQDVKNVTHQGSQSGGLTAPLAAWTQDSASSSPDTTFVVSAQPATAAVAPSRCCGCRMALPAFVRQGFLRHGAAPGWHGPRGWRHDHSP